MLQTPQHNHFLTGIPGPTHAQYGNRDFGGQAPVRRHKPDAEAVSLSDYRTRHAQYKTDKSLQRLLARVPLIAVWCVEQR